MKGEGRAARHANAPQVEPVRRRGHGRVFASCQRTPPSECTAERALVFGTTLEAEELLARRHAEVPQPRERSLRPNQMTC